MLLIEGVHHVCFIYDGICIFKLLTLILMIKERQPDKRSNNERETELLTNRKLFFFFLGGFSFIHVSIIWYQLAIHKRFLFILAEDQSCPGIMHVAPQRGERHQPVITAYDSVADYGGCLQKCFKATYCTAVNYHGGY